MYGLLCMQIPRNEIDAKILRNIKEKNTDLNKFVLKKSTSQDDILKILIDNTSLRMC